MSEPRIPPELLRRMQRARQAEQRTPIYPSDVMARARANAASAPDEPDNQTDNRQDDEQRPQHDELPVPSSVLHRNVQFPQLYDKAYLQQALAKGWSYFDIAADVGCSRPSVYHALRRAQLIMIPRPDIEHPFLSDRANVYAMIERGLSLREMAEEANAAIWTVRSWLAHYALSKAQREAHRAVVATRSAERAPRPRKYPNGKYPQLRDLVWLQEQLDTRSMTDIAREIGCDLSTVWRAADRHGLQYRGTLHRMAHMSDTTYTFPQSDPHPAPRGAAFGTNYGMVNAFKDYLKANPGTWFELGVVKTGGIGISNGKGFEFTTRSKDPDGNPYLVEGSSNPDGTPRKGVRVWGRYTPPAA